jgi:glycosyltransferase involved in cell wall biosynthesis
MVKKKIIICHAYPPVGGGGMIQDVLTETLYLSLPDATFQLFELNESGTIKGGYLPLLLKTIRTLRNGLDCDLIILQGFLNPATAIVGFYVHRKKIPYIVIPRGDYVPTIEFWSVVRRPFLKCLAWLVYGKRFVEKAKKVVTTSELEKSRMEDIGIKSLLLCVIPDTIMPNCQTADGDSKNIKLEFDLSKPFALWLGRIAQEKGLDLMINCWSKVIEHLPEAKLILAGSIIHPTTYKYYKKLIIESNLGASIDFVDWVSGEEKNQLLRRARCLLLPSHFESFGAVVLEALRVQTPVIASTGTPWAHINGWAGCWLERNPVLWAESCLNYLSTPDKQQVPLEFVNKLLEPYEKRSVAKKWETVFDDLNM